MRDWVEGNAGEGHLWSERQESLEQAAGRIVEDGLQAIGWGADRLRTERKGHPVKVALARRLRRETTMTLKWIAENLQMAT